jgi:hypothetical protein
VVARYYGKDPIVPSRLRFGTMSAIGLAAKAVGAAAIWRFRSGGEGQDINVDVRKATWPGLPRSVSCRHFADVPSRVEATE